VGKTPSNASLASGGFLDLGRAVIAAGRPFRKKKADDATRAIIREDKISAEMKRWMTRSIIPRLPRRTGRRQATGIEIALTAKGCVASAERDRAAGG
jgi:hypothetical protein